MVFSQQNQPSKADSMARSFVLWLHGLGDSGPANEPIKTVFTSPEFRNTVWSFPSAPFNPVTCNNGAVMPSWFDIHEMPVTADSPKDESSVLKAVQNVHAMIDKEIAAGTAPNNVFVCGLSQGGFPLALALQHLPPSPLSFSPPNAHTPSALALASVLLYPKTLGGGAVFSGWVPFNSSIIQRIPPNAKRILWRVNKSGVDLNLLIGCSEVVLDGSKSLTETSCMHSVLMIGTDYSGDKGQCFLFARDYPCKRTPVLWCHGTEDRTVLFEAGQAGPPFLEQAGVSCEFKAYPGLGHTITTEELKYLESWIKTRMQSSS
ncbi:Acyl-protein thioesterase 1 [Morella rubra]|uniref:Acyl-protein thioesterase 1 n=1 Tax=Morella rubra TaxID=262757 RepID=A0A6A1VLF7_9ROSI|nr:Acyl-protein thioesterase 1 [Morella rubra]KAB1221751.1 Acyl-protein thioesterase 1 [Morella rubra]